MAITRTPIIDDNGTGTTGTIINNAWKQELYNQIDAFAPQASVLVKQSATTPNTATGFVNVVSATIPALALTDTLRVIVTLSQGSTAGVSLYLGTTAAQLVRFDDLGTGRPMNANEFGLWEFTLRAPVVDATSVQITAVGGIGGQPGAVRPVKVPLGGSLNWVTGGWLLFLQSGGQAAGGTQSWAWTIVKI